MAKSKQTQSVVLPDFDIRSIEVPVRGLTPVIMNKFSDQTIKEMLDKQGGAATKGREHKNIEKNFNQAIYRLPDGSIGLPALAFKKSMIRAAKSLNIAMTDATGAFNIIADADGLIRITGEPRTHIANVRVGNGAADIRIRAEVPEWTCVLKIKFNNCVLSAEQLASMIQCAGFSVGVGDWRIEKKGINGQFEIAA